MQRGTEKLDAVPADDEARSERRPIVRRGVVQPERQRDADECEGARDGVRAMMPRIRLHCAGANLHAGVRDFAKEHFLYDDDEHEHAERKRRRHLVRRADFANALHREADGGGEDDEGDHDGGDDLGFSMAVGMFLIRRLGCDAQAKPHDERAEDIEQRLHPVGDERVGVAEQTGHDFDDGEHGIYQHAQHGEARAGEVSGACRELGCGLGRFVHVRAP